MDSLPHPEKEARLERMLAHLRANSSLSVTEASKRFDASPATIRRDFQLLENEGKVRKVWGGVRITTEKGQGAQLPYSYRASLNLEEKRRIARHAADLVEDGDVVMIDGGSTTFWLAERLCGRPVQIVTNSLVIGSEIDRLRKVSGGPEVYLVGGFMYPQSNLVVGPQAISAIEHYSAKWCFLSCRGVTEKGVTNDNALVVDTEQAMIRQSTHVAVLADHTKLDQTSLSRICSLDTVSKLIVDEHDVSVSFAEKTKLGKRLALV